MKSAAEKIVEVNQRPDDGGKEDGFGHGRRLHVEHRRIEGVDGGGQRGGSQRGAGTDEAVDSGDSENVGEHGRNGAADAGAPEPVIGNKGRDEQMRQREPYGSDLIPARVARVGEAAGNVEVGDGIAVEEDVSVTVEPGEGDYREQERKRGDQDDFATGLHAVLRSVSSRSITTSAPPVSQDG